MDPKGKLSSVRRIREEGRYRRDFAMVLGLVICHTWQDGHEPEFCVYV
jgi:hypothetical protein